jgi:mono/diheme cytochrome c family protein
MMRSLPALALAIALLGIVPAGAETPMSKIADGRGIALKVCASCHVVVSDQVQPPTLKPPAPPFAEIAAGPKVTEAYLRDFLTKPHGEARSVSAIPGFLMPSRQADAIIAYLMSLKAKP